MNRVTTDPEEIRDGRLVRGHRTRQAILERAVATASVEGLEGLSLADLAGQLNVSKSGVFAHFGSKEELQLATVEAARGEFFAQVVEPARRHPPGLRRLWTLCEKRVAWMCSCPGGCFFYSVSAEYDARPGRIHDLLKDYRQEWARGLERSIKEAQQAGEIRADVDAKLLAFELDAYAVAANGDALLLGDEGLYRQARRAILQRLRSVAVDPSVLPQRA